MSANLIAKASTTIAAPAQAVWDALTNPKLIKQYFFGTDAISDWQEDSPLEFKGEWNGKQYVDKGVILKSEPLKLFQYTYLSSFSGLDDIPENYSNITYELFEDNGTTTLNIKQENIANDEVRKHAEENWAQVLNNLKDLLEK